LSAAGPLRRIMPTDPVPGGVAIAAMVSWLRTVWTSLRQTEGIIGTVKKLLLLFLYFFTVPYAVCYNFTIKLFFDDGLA
jgi:hypothetical protein